MAKVTFRCYKGRTGEYEERYLVLDANGDPRGPLADLRKAATDAQRHGGHVNTVTLWDDIEEFVTSYSSPEYSDLLFEARGMIERAAQGVPPTECQKIRCPSITSGVCPVDCPLDN